MRHYTIYYAKPAYASQFMIDPGEVDGFNFVRTHRRVHDLEAENMEEVFMKMQGESEWDTPEEMRNRIQALNLSHTSMSVGDLVEFYAPMELDKGNHFVMKRFVYVVDFCGFKKITPTTDPKPDDNF